MRYRLLHNQDSQFFRAGTPEDTYVVGHYGHIEDSLHRSISAILEEIYMRHNRDDRPDGQTRPSLSVGDVIHLSSDLEPVNGFWTVDMVGFVGISPITTEYLSDYPR